jgi:alcohol dehydrogenase class IV
MDILCHALESYTARWYADFDAKEPEERVPYCGANPIADMWSERAMSLLAGAFRRAIKDGSDTEAREQMAMAATFAGLGFGNAGVHIPHANAYPIAGRVSELSSSFVPEGYPEDEPIVPHGMAVSLTAPAAFRFTFDAAPERHLRAARILDPDASGDGPELLASVLTALIRDIGIPNGLAEVGYGVSDVDDLVAGATQQHRLLATAPKAPTEEDLAQVFVASMEHW